MHANTSITAWSRTKKILSLLKPIIFEPPLQRRPDPSPLESISSILTFIRQTYQVVKSSLFWVIGLPPQIRAVVTYLIEYIREAGDVAGDIVCAVGFVIAAGMLGVILFLFTWWMALKSVDCLHGWYGEAQSMGQAQSWWRKKNMGVYDGCMERRVKGLYERMQDEQQAGGQYHRGYSHQKQHHQHQHQHKEQQQQRQGEKQKQQSQRPSIPLRQTQRKAIHAIDYLAVYQRWRKSRTEVLERKEKMAIFPAPPKLPCGIPSCTATDQGRLGICKHGLRRLYQAAVSSGIVVGDGKSKSKSLIQLLMAERAIWHPDRFSLCPARTRVEIVGVATELFQVIGSIIDDERR